MEANDLSVLMESRITIRDLRQFLNRLPDDYYVMFGTQFKMCVDKKFDPDFNGGVLEVRSRTVKELKQFLDYAEMDFGAPIIGFKDFELSFRSEGLYIHDMSVPFSAGWYAAFYVYGGRSADTPDDFPDKPWGELVEERVKDHKERLQSLQGSAK